MSEIHFPAPREGWGRVVAFVVPNPRWRWWAFWRRRVIVMSIEPKDVK